MSHIGDTSAPPAAADRRHEMAVSTYNLENLYDFRDSPDSGCDFPGDPGCVDDGTGDLGPADIHPDPKQAIPPE